MKNKTSQSGFTLIELIAVMVILGILAAVIIPRITTITSGAYESNVRNMYGLIKNEVTAQAVKAAMSGNFLETYPNPSDGNENVYLKEWVADYDPSAWTQFQAPNEYDNSDDGAGNNHEILFMYHPHGIPGVQAWTGTAGQLTPDQSAGDASTSKEDIYYIMYAARTSHRGAAAGRVNDGFVMGAWKSTALDWTFDGSINASGSVASGATDAKLDDLDFLLDPQGP